MKSVRVNPEEQDGNLEETDKVNVQHPQERWLKDVQQ